MNIGLGSSYNLNSSLHSIKFMGPINYSHGLLSVGPSNYTITGFYLSSSNWALVENIETDIWFWCHHSTCTRSFWYVYSSWTFSDILAEYIQSFSLKLQLYMSEFSYFLVKLMWLKFNHFYLTSICVWS